MGNALEEKITKIIKGETVPFEQAHRPYEYMTEQLSQLFRTEMLSIIGEDEEIFDPKVNSTPYGLARNKLRKYLRSTLEERVK